MHTLNNKPKPALASVAHPRVRALLLAAQLGFGCWSAASAQAPQVEVGAPLPAAPAPASVPAPDNVPAPSAEPAASITAPPAAAAATPHAEAPVTPAEAPASAPAAAPGAPKASEAPSVLAAQGKGITVTSADGNFQATFRSRIQLRESFARDDAGSSNEVQVKTLRLFAQGHAFVPELKYTIQLAFGTGDFDKDGSSPIFDAFVDYVKLRDLNVRVGQYFVPFDRARTIREFALQLVDRQIVVRELTLDRDVGLMLSSSDLFGLDGKLAYNLFVGGGDGRNRIADTKNPKGGAQVPGGLFVGRITVRPMGPFDDDQEGDLKRSQKPHLALGAGVGYNVSTSRPQSTYATNNAVGTFAAGTFNYLHGAADLVFKWHGFSLLAEGLIRDANKKTNTGTDAAGAPFTEYSREGWGYFVQGGQMLSDRLEVVARWDDLYANDGTDPDFVKLVKTRGRQVGGGLNYYLNGHFLKLQTDYHAIYGTRTTDDLRHAFRVQLDASF